MWGEPASRLNMPAGCPFADRCPQAEPGCRIAEPPMQIWNGHMARCIAAGL
jgi:peptide/nickel transport system ATP-binding protein